MLHQTSANQDTLSSLNVNCSVEYGGRLLKEGTIMTIRKKLYKVEDCHLQRAYQTCGIHLWSILNIVCEAVETEETNRLHYIVRRFTRIKLLSEACCLDVCTVSEMTRYCP